MSDLTEYVVLADAINVTTGRKPNGRPVVARLFRNSTLNAPADDERVLDLLAMGGIVARADLKDRIKELGQKSTRSRPLIQKATDNKPRITAAGTAVTMAAGDDLPEQPVLDIVPVDASDPDLAPVDTI